MMDNNILYAILNILLSLGIFIVQIRKIIRRKCENNFLSVALFAVSILWFSSQSYLVYHYMYHPLTSSEFISFVTYVQRPIATITLAVIFSYIYARRDLL